MKNKEKKKKYVLRRLITCLLVLVLFSLGSFQIIRLHLDSYMEEARDSLVGTLTAETYRYNSLTRLSDSYHATLRNTGEFYTRFAVDTVGRLREITPETLQSVTNRFGADTFLYYYPVNGKVISSPDAPELSFSDEETEALHRDGYLFRGDAFYSCGQYRRDWLIVMWNGLDNMSASIAVETDSYSGEKFMWIDHNGKVTESSDDEVIGYSFERERYLQILSSCDDESLNVDNDIEYIYLARNMGDAGILLAYIPAVTMLVTGIVRRTMVPILLLLVACITMLRYANSLYVEHRNNPERRSERKLFKSLCVDRLIVSHLSALVIFCMILLGFSTWYIQSLTAQSDFNISSRSDFSHVAQALDENKQSREKVISFMDGKYNSIAKVIAQTLKDAPPKCSSEGLAEIAALLPEIQDISVFDQSGLLVASSKNTAGYYLSNNPEDDEYECWQLLTGGLTELIIRSDNMPESEFVCIRRTDAPGLLRLTIDLAPTKAIIADMNFDNALTATNTGNTSVMTVRANDLSTMYIAEHDSPTVTQRTNPIPEEKLVDGYSGFLYVDGALQYIAVMTYDDMYFINMANGFDVMGNTILWSILIGEIVCISVFLLVVLMTALFKNSGTRLNENGETGIFHQVFTNNQKVDRRFARCLQGMLASAALWLLFLLLLDARVSKQSLLGFLTGQNWMHGVNMFSGTVILFIFTIEQIISLLLGRLILLIAGNLGPKGKTIGRMLASLFRFILLLSAIVLSLFELGVNITTVLAGAGIIGAALSLCAQSTVSDLLAGFFIIFENRVQVGDWISVGGWRGQVKEIGMRTTTISRGGDVQIVSNSKLNESTVLNPKLHGSVVELSVSYDEDLDEVFKLIEDNRALYRKEIPAMDDGPYVYGVTNLGADGVDFKLIAFADEPKVCHVERELRRVTKKLFDEHGVEIPWRQVVIHEGRSLLDTAEGSKEK